MRLGSLLREAGLAGEARLTGDPTVEVRSIGMDSRTVGPGVLFVCVPGRHHDGHELAGEALQAGAVALVCERPLPHDVPQVVVPSARRAVGPLADALFGHPSRDLRVVGVTGTNGKTTTCALLHAIFEAEGWPAAVLGTLSQQRTTPEAPELQARLAELREGGVRAVAMEVSSHALDQHRTDAVRFAAGVLTNVTQDHLDYHGTMDAYFEAKASLFEPGRVGVAVVNRADPYGRVLIDRLEQAGVPVETFASEDAEGLELLPRGSRFRWRGRDVTVRVGGRFNVDNALAAATCAAALGAGTDSIAHGLAAVEQVRGRFEPVEAGQPFTVLVDYAHTPDGLARALRAARELTGGRLLVVFGAGGDRDHDKRPLMGATAAALADLAVVTSDNPRGEDPGSIIEQILAGAPAGANLVVDPDRERAITTALANAAPGDVVVIAGKGHETGQEIGGRVLPFDDVEVTRRALERILTSRRERR